jgi:DNA-binding transcriptional MerR regulator
VSAVPSRSLMSIGEVLAQLRQEFPEVSLSKIRFLESEGLVEPARTPSGYRKFSHHDVARLHYVLAAQRDHYLPLRVIKDHLDALDRGEDPSNLGRGSAGGARPMWGPRSLGDAGEVRLTRAELIESAGIDADLLSQIEGFGLVTPLRRGSGQQERFDADALAIATAVADLAGFGLEPRHLRSFRSAADREVDLVGQVVGPLLRQRSPQARARAEEVAREMAAVSVRLHTALVRARLRDVAGS